MGLGTLDEREIMRRLTAALLIIMAYALSGCSQIADFTLKDAQAAKARATLHSDVAGVRCWTFIETRLQTDDLNPNIVGIMDFVEAARVVRLESPELRKKLTEGCGEVFSDVMVEIAKRVAKRGL